MSKELYISPEGVARYTKKAYLGIDNKARKIKKVYLGVNGSSKLIAERHQYFLRFQPNGGSGSTFVRSVETFQSLEKGVTFWLPSNPFGKEHYKFVGWKDDSTGKVYQPGATYTLSAWEVTFSAQWELKKYKLIPTGNCATSVDHQYVYANGELVWTNQSSKSTVEFPAGTTIRYVCKAENNPATLKIYGQDKSAANAGAGKWATAEWSETLYCDTKVKMTTSDLQMFGYHYAYYAEMIVKKA